MRLRLCVIGVLWAVVVVPQGVSAQGADTPLIETELEATEVIPGQPVTFRVTVLVPTWLSRPIEFPSFEAPNLMVKLFDKSTTPVSRTVDGETWSGVTRVYRMSPMVAGSIPIPAQNLTVLWAVPGDPDPKSAVVQTEAFTLQGLRPEGTQDLSPFIAANSLTLTQEMSSDSRVLMPGDSLTRTITVEMSGASPFVLPSLLDAAPIPGLATYPAEPVLAERVEDGWLSGTRTESITWVAESGGSGEAPEVEVQWYNLQTSTVETARVERFELTVDAPVARNRPSIDGPAMVRLLGVLLVLAGVVYLAWRFAIPPLRAWTQARKAARLASEDHAFRMVRRAIADRNYARFADALDIWALRLNGADPLTDPDLAGSTSALGAAMHGTQAGDPELAWRALDRAVVRARTHFKSTHRHEPGFAPLNPVR